MSPSPATDGRLDSGHATAHKPPPARGDQLELAAKTRDTVGPPTQGGHFVTLVPFIALRMVSQVVALSLLQPQYLKVAAS